MISEYTLWSINDIGARDPPYTHRKSAKVGFRQKDQKQFTAVSTPDLVPFLSGKPPETHPRRFPEGLRVTMHPAQPDMDFLTK